MGLTEKRIRDAKPEPKTCFLWDPAFKNFGVRIAPGGTKAYVLDFHEAGKHRRVTIARVGEMSLKAARALASDQMAAVRAGEAHLLDKRREARDLPTVADAVRRFLDEHSARRIANGRMSPRTVKDYRSQCASTILPAIGARTVASVETADIERIVDPLRPVMRNRVLALASRIFTLCEHWGWRPQRTNPARGIERAVENARDRTLTPAEFAALAGALAARADGQPGRRRRRPVCRVDGLADRRGPRRQAGACRYRDRTPASAGDEDGAALARPAVRCSGGARRAPSPQRMVLHQRGGPPSATSTRKPSSRQPRATPGRQTFASTTCAGPS